MTQEIQVIVVDERVHEYGMPKSHTQESAGMDMRAFPVAPFDGYITFDETTSKVHQKGDPVPYINIGPGETVMVSTGLRVWVEHRGWAGFLLPRSGTGTKGLVLGNGTGLIDADYQGELKMCLWNRTNETIRVNAGDRVAQLVLLPVMVGHTIKMVEGFTATTERGESGFGSTGVA